MKTLLTSFFVFFLLLGLSAQSNFKAERAIDYNDFFVEQQNLIHEGLKLFNEDISINLDSARLDLAVVNLMVNLALDDLKAAEVYEGGGELKSAYIQLFEYYELVTKEHFVEVLDLISVPEMNEEQRLRLQDVIDDVTQREIPLDKRVKDAQEAFAKMHGFTLD